MELLFSTISKIGKVSQELQEDIAQRLISVKCKKKDVILREGDVCNYLYFVTEGLLRTYYEKDGRDVSAQFMEKGDFVISILSFFQREPSFDYIEALEDCEMVAIHHDDLMYLYDKHVEFNVIGRKITQAYYCLAELRVIGMRMQNAKARYQHLLNHHSNLINKVPLKALASYLGMTPETLSRMRANR